MISFVFSKLEYPFQIEPGSIVDLAIEAPALFRELFNVLLREDEEELSITEDGKAIDFGKSCVVIPNLFDMNPNNKRILTAIYKKVDRSCLTQERREKFDRINLLISELIGDIASDFEGSTAFNQTLAIPQILGLMDFKFDYDDSTFLSSFISFVKANREAMNLKLVFVNNLFALLDERFIDDLSTELSYIGVGLINISNRALETQNSNVKKVIVDRDLCEIY